MNEEFEFNGVKAFAPIPAALYEDEFLMKKYPRAILLLGQILGMLNTTGSFYMSNDKIAKRMKATKQAVNDWLKILEERNYIRREKIHDKETNAVIGRKIYAGEALVKCTSLGWSTAVGGGSKAELNGVVKPTWYKENNSREQNNRTNNNSSTKVEQQKPKPKSLTKKLEEEFEQIWKDYPKKRGKQKALSHYKAWRKRSKANTFERAKQALSDYKRYVETTRANGFRDLQWRDGSTWFNGGMDDDYSVDDANGKKLQNLDSLLNTAPEGIISDDDLPF
ncbi:MarR family transcriptional regulator [Lactobacillus kalixensis]|uniref:Phage replication protein n=1 Tax=Lactobacillus kalixensis DSM 16043 TaxID=1423763 RepID=A0A0R1U626_9LACO|nr:MarR family transcriptional regulator [Lactobacillus kalixensis]KRL88681.1 phage replication protein [Lactobacillus kalixensis DSM 16043]